ncbi:MAG: DNA polymerase III subunit gamma/tau [Flavobacteriales bacterium]|nr:DNA polymerase III subunit gamma/tau [Flavobacteriales bacterium]PIV92707.1 MAG: DNA polymerase III subunit gamma/tau [Flavobacteriaceae bacterium CG17_big_fil_post_rev_8_21_14_2_50_33_15]PIY10772.1 MAG: DNA polymerase III subunit gamma/tau [Flavobacteriaceae bacterium CG_4_10_14_3_um_filter_33_47]PJB18365.1 MAG: DNA polymerase III subunit gamma/tau [Flavobacteriaceae bacterium CG_4_9_14_3_um_filter_33_16]NCP53239.1 DNA polymerase III subunit gamma/tau [Flavobacteriales bacterium]
MEHFIVSARKYRPQTFKDVVGQQAITNTLLNAIENNHLAQALLFTGPRGVGKTTCARILAKMINSEGSVSEDEDFAFNIFELDAASNNSVDDIRSLTDQVRIPPQLGKYKVYIIDEVHMLSQSAFNAFLKTLEEPPKHCIFILATTEKHKIIPTILSRCQIFDFKRITVKDAKEYLKYIAKEQGVIADDDALHIIAQKADGAMRDALSIFDRVVSFSGKNLSRQSVTENLNVLDYETYFTSTDLILENKIPELLIQFNETLSKGFDGHHYIAGLASHFRDLLVSKTPQTVELLEVGEQTKLKYLEQAKKTSQEFLLNGIDLANHCDLKFKSSKNQRLLVELCLMQLASITFDGEKKNSKHYIIPPSYFKNKGINPIPVNFPNIKKEDTAETTLEPNLKKENKETFEKEIISENVMVEEPPKVVLKIDKKRTSGLSLSSIKTKKEHLIKQMDVIVNEEDLPKEGFTESQLIESWNTYIKNLQDNGKHNLASILSIDTPKVKGTTVYLEFPNSTNKVELERQQYELLSFLRKSLNNFDIDFSISVNEEKEKQYAYTAKEKFEKLKEKNPNIELLRKTFDLDI